MAFRVLEDGTVVVESESIDLLSLAGMLEPRRKGVTIADMDEAIRTRAGTR